jgi:hypothetical protein
MRLSSMADNPERRPHGDPIPGTSGLSSPWRLPPATRLPAPSHLPPPSLATSPQTHGLRLWSRSGPPAAVVGRDIPPPTVRVLSEQSRLPPSALAAVASGPPSPWYESYSGGARSCFAPESVHHADPGGGGDARCDGGAPLTHIRAAPAALPRADDTRRSPLFFSKHLAYRSFVCAIAICLLWMTSLSATRYLVQAALVSPPFLLVASECRRTYSEVLRQKSDYVRCTSVQLKQCDEALAKSVSAEEARAASATEANSGTLGEARVTRIRCSAARAQALAALRALQRRGGLLRWDERACSAGEVHSVQALVSEARLHPSITADLNAFFTCSHFVQGLVNVRLRRLFTTGVNVRLSHLFTLCARRWCEVFLCLSRSVQAPPLPSVVPCLYLSTPSRLTSPPPLGRRHIYCHPRCLPPPHRHSFIPLAIPPLPRASPSPTRWATRPATVRRRWASLSPSPSVHARSISGLRRERETGRDTTAITC